MPELSPKRAEFAELSAAILNRGGSFRFKARGSSMYPFIRDGDIVTIQPVEAAALKVGDVVFYSTARGRLSAHRVVGREVQRGQVVLATRGDAASGPDERVQAEQVLGRVVSVQRGRKIIRLDGGFWRLAALLWIRLSPLGFLLFRLAGAVKRAALWLLRRLQALKPYRVLARKVIGTRVRYRIATAGDASDLSRLYGYERFPEQEDPVRTFAGQLESLEGCGYPLIARVGGRIAGAAFIGWFPENEALYPDRWIFGMLVRTRYRGAGIGEGLVRTALEKALEEGATRMNLLVFEQNRAAVKLYRKMGFRPASIPGLNDQLEEEVRRGERRRIIMSRPVGPSLVSQDD